MRWPMSSVWLRDIHGLPFVLSEETQAIGVGSVKSAKLRQSTAVHDYSIKHVQFVVRQRITHDR